MTAQELLGLSIPGKKHELVDGIVVEMEPPGAEHGWVANRLAVRLTAHVDGHELGVVLGEVGFLLRSDPDRVLAPDVAFIARDRVACRPLTAAYWPGAPDLAVEVVSPRDRWIDVERKASMWLEAGTGAVLVVDPPLRTAIVLRAPDRVARHRPGDRVELSDVVPGWRPLLDDLLI